MVRILTAFFFLNISSSCFLFSEWPNYGGPDRNQVSNEKGLRLSWKNDEPQVIWELDVGLGYSSVVESGGFAYTQGNTNSRNTLYCVNSESGKIIWKHSYPCKKDPKYFDGGSRSTPTIANKMIFLCSHEGDLYALDAKTGSIKWTKNLLTDFDGKRPTWGFAGSPLFVNDKLILETGSSDGSLVCLNAESGDLIWKSGESEAGYASPMLYGEELDEVLVFNQFGLVLHNLKYGSIIRKYQHTTRYGINAAQPMVIGNKIFISSAYGKGASLVDFNRRKPISLWESDSFSCQMASLVKMDNFAYGIHGQAGSRSDQSKLFCLDLRSGKEMWSQKGFGLGTVVLVRDTLVIMSDEGVLSLVRANSSKYEELFQTQVLSGKSNWIPVTYVNGKLHCRSAKGKWVCLAMSTEIKPNI
jgi:outer membrane protein assembly factor BamB